MNYTFTHFVLCFLLNFFFFFVWYREGRCWRILVLIQSYLQIVTHLILDITFLIRTTLFIFIYIVDATFVCFMKKKNRNLNCHIVFIVNRVGESALCIPYERDNKHFVIITNMRWRIFHLMTKCEEERRMKRRNI